MVKSLVKVENIDNYDEFIPYDNELEEPFEVPYQEATDYNGKLINLNHVKDQMINLEIRLHSGQTKMVGKVIIALVDKDGKLIESSDPNPMLNTCLYNIEFNGGSTQIYSANYTATNIWEQVNDEGFILMLLYIMLLITSLLAMQLRMMMAILLTERVNSK